MRVAKKYLSYFQGPVGRWECADQRLAARDHPGESPAHLRRSRGYRDARRHRLGARAAAPLRTRDGDGAGHESRDARSASSPTTPRIWPARSTATAPTRPPASCSCATRSTCRCSSCATRPASWSGPEIEKTALVRHAARMFVVGANISVPFFTIVLRKGYGLGAQAMAGGSFKTPIFTVSWPTGEFGGMGLEGAVKLGYRKELEAIDDPAAAQEAVRRDGGADVPARQGAQQRLAFRARRRDRPGRIAPLDSHGTALGASARTTHWQKAPARRFVVSKSPAGHGAFRLPPSCRSG